MTASKIEWTDRSDWNPLRGCTRVSQGCVHCYAETLAARFSDPEQAFHGFATRTAAGARWTGRVELIENRLALPLSWRKPARIFASSTSDVFHEGLPDEAIDRMFAVMALAPRHTFQVLTKRAERMRQYLSHPGVSVRVGLAALGMVLDAKAQDPRSTLGTGVVIKATDINPGALATWPLSNVWLGVSVEDQAAADARIHQLIATPAAKRFLSCEPLLGELDLVQLQSGLPASTWLTWLDAIDWVIVGGESGRGARPMHPDWVRSLRDQCVDSDVPFFFKQWGEWAPGECATSTIGKRSVRTADWFNDAWVYETMRGDLELHADDEPALFWTGKKAAGCLLDGIRHYGMPA